MFVLSSLYRFMKKTGENQGEKSPIPVSRSICHAGDFIGDVSDQVIIASSWLAVDLPTNYKTRSIGLMTMEETVLHYGNPTLA